MKNETNEAYRMNVADDTKLQKAYILFFVLVALILVIASGCLLLLAIASLLQGWILSSVAFAGYAWLATSLANKSLDVLVIKK